MEDLHVALQADLEGEGERHRACHHRCWSLPEPLAYNYCIAAWKLKADSTSHQPRANRTTQKLLLPPKQEHRCTEAASQAQRWQQSTYKLSRRPEVLQMRAVARPLDPCDCLGVGRSSPFGSGLRTHLGPSVGVGWAGNTRAKNRHSYAMGWLRHGSPQPFPANSDATSPRHPCPASSQSKVQTPSNIPRPRLGAEPLTQGTHPPSPACLQPPCSETNAFSWGFTAI